MNISVAIIPMAKAFGWSPTVAGLVQSSFFWGYMVSQIPGGYVNTRFGGRTVLPIGVGLWSGATAAVPVLAGTIPGVSFFRHRPLLSPRLPRSFVSTALRRGPIAHLLLRSCGADRPCSKSSSATVCERFLLIPHAPHMTHSFASSE